MFTVDYGPEADMVPPDIASDKPLVNPTSALLNTIVPATCTGAIGGLFNGTSSLSQVMNNCGTSLMILGATALLALIIVKHI
jgi:hypothetical protein